MSDLDSRHDMWHELPAISKLRSVMQMFLLAMGQKGISAHWSVQNSTPIIPNRFLGRDRWKQVGLRETVLVTFHIRRNGTAPPTHHLLSTAENVLYRPNFSDY